MAPNYPLQKFQKAVSMEVRCQKKLHQVLCFYGIQALSLRLESKIVFADQNWKKFLHCFEILQFKTALISFERPAISSASKLEADVLGILYCI